MPSNRDGWRVADLLRHGALQCRDAGLEAPHAEAELLIAHCLEVTRTQLHLQADEVVDRELVDRCQQMLDRRCRREPLAYITGEREFWCHTFNVSPAVLIPRPETELLVERVIASNPAAYARGPCLDLCCGSGIIAIVLALELELEVIGVEISRPALQVCLSNCIRHGVAHKIALLEADLTSCFGDNVQFGLITANPPYVSSTEMAGGMQPEVIEFEPALALDGGTDGFRLIRRIIDDLPRMLAPGGLFFMEIGAEQGTEVQKLLNDSNANEQYESIELMQDYSGRDRLIQVRKKYH